MQPSLLEPGTLFHHVFHASPVGMVITTVAEGRYVEVNEAFARLLGYSRDELLSQNFTMMGVRNPEERKMVLSVLRIIRQLGDIPLVLNAQDGKARTCVGSVQLEEFNGEDYFVIMVQDLSDHEEAQNALRLSENRFRLFFQSIPLPLLVLDEETYRVLDVNAAACEVYGYSRNEFAGLSMTNLMPAEDWAGYLSAIRNDPASAAGKTVICRQLLKDGRIIEVDVTSYSFLLDERRAMLSIIRDVTEQRAIQAALSAGEEYLRIIADVVTDAIWDRDLATDDVEWSAGIKSLFGYEEDEGDRPHNWWINHVHPDERQPIEESIKTFFASGENDWTAEYRFLRADGTYANVLDRAFIIRDSDGRPARFIGAMVDITENLQVAEATARAKLEERRRLARDLHDSVTQSLYSVSLMAEAARRQASAGDHEATTEYIGRLGELSLQALRQLRLLVYELRPGVLEQVGLAGALRNRLEAVEQRAGVRAALIDESEATIPTPLQVELFHIAQVALNYTLHQSMTTEVTIRLRNLPGEFILEISDNGMRLDALTAEDSEGLTALDHRVISLGGDLEIDTLPEGGVIWRIRLPLPDAIPDRVA